MKRIKNLKRKEHLLLQLFCLPGDIFLSDGRLANQNWQESIFKIHKTHFVPAEIPNYVWNTNLGAKEMGGELGRTLT